MLTNHHTLPELAEALGIPVARLIQYGINGRVIIGVIADHWLGTSGPERADTLLEGLVELQPEDLRRSLDAGYTVVRQALMKGVKDVVTLNAPVDVKWGVHYVTEEERQRFMRYYRPIEEMHGGERPPYLDPKHPYYSDNLEAGISAWIALYVNEGFEKQSGGHINQIENWLKEHRPQVKSTNARAEVARMVNPNKEGGNPKTRKS